jgi:hypothetical protein
MPLMDFLYPITIRSKQKYDIMKILFNYFIHIRFLMVNFQMYDKV